MTKKQFRKDIETKLDTAFGHLAKGADKKFRKILKKASQLLTDVLHKPEPKPGVVKSKEIITKTATKTAIKAAIKAAPKAAPKKKAPVKAVKKSVVKKK
jgi:hypothetical protein